MIGRLQPVLHCDWSNRVSIGRALNVLRMFGRESTTVWSLYKPACSMDLIDLNHLLQLFLFSNDASFIRGCSANCGFIKNRNYSLYLYFKWSVIRFLLSLLLHCGDSPCFFLVEF